MHNKKYSPLLLLLTVMIEGTGERNKEVASSECGGGKKGELLCCDTSGLIITEGCRLLVLLLKDMAVGDTVMVLKTDEGVNDGEVKGSFWPAHETFTASVMYSQHGRRFFFAHPVKRQVPLENSWFVWLY